MQGKKDLRKRMLAARAAFDPEEKQKFDQFICEEIGQKIEELGAQVIHTFLPMGDEINIFLVIKMMLQNGLTVVAPKSVKSRRMENLVLKSLDELEEGIFGTRHPANSYQYVGYYDLFIVPGLAFDKRGYRLGYGAGYYDMFLAAQLKGHKLGVCYPFQVVEHVPAEAHDVPMNDVLNGLPKKWKVT